MIYDYSNSQLKNLHKGPLALKLVPTENEKNRKFQAESKDLGGGGGGGGGGNCICSFHERLVCIA